MIFTLPQTIESSSVHFNARTSFVEKTEMKAIMKSLPLRSFLFILPLLLLFSGCKRDKFKEGLLAIKPCHFLEDKKFEELVIEVCYIDGYKPEQASLDNLKSFLEERLNKPDGISFSYKSIPSPGNSVYDQTDLEDIEEDYRTQFSKRKKLTVWMFFADAPYSNPGTLGLQYGTTSCAVFEKTVMDNSGGIGEPNQVVLETTVEEHEFGHLLGLVDAGTPMVSAHAENHQHCNNSNCLMYYAVETLDILSNLTGGEVPRLDENCIVDLQANGGK